MIDKNKVINLVNEKLDEKMFIVDISVNQSNVIQVFVDGFDGMPIEKCIEISRNIEHNLDREKEDFELQVSSPGLTEPFKVLNQYYKHQNKEVEIVSKSGEKLKGVLKSVDDIEVVLETSKREKIEGHKKKQLIIKENKFKYEEIKSAKAIISFK